jgi:hypothetical protein
MIKRLLSLACLFSGMLINAQTFNSTYNFASVTSTTGLIDPTPTPTAVGVTFGSFSAVGTPSANPNAGGRFSFVGWPLGSLTGTISTDVYANMTGSINLGQYYEVTLTPASNYTVSLNTMSFGIRRSGTGIRNYAVRSSQSNYTVNLPASVGTNTNLSVVANDVFLWNFDATSTSSDQVGSAINFGPTSFSSPITLRFYAWNAEASGGTFSIDNVVFNGSVSCPTPSITSISSNGPICANQNLELSATASGDGTLTYTWTGNGTISDASALTTTVTNASGDYTLSASNYCSTVSSVINPTVNAIPVVQVNSTAICNGGTATLTATGADTYTWSTGANTDAISDNPVTETTYTVTGTSSAGCVAASFATATISIISTPTITVNSPSICAGATATLTAGGASTYSWSTNQNSATINVSPSADESYTVTASVAGCSGTFSNIANVTVNALPTVSISTANAICAGESATLTANGAATYTWSAGTQTLTSIVVTPTTTSNYTVNAQSAEGCSNSASISVTVNPLPVLNSTNQTICLGETATLNVTGAQTYTWTTTPSVSGDTYTITPDASGTTVYTVVGTSSLSCSNSRTVSINTRALPNISANATSTSICSGESVTLFGIGGGLTTYTWTGGVSNGTAFQPTATETYTVSSTGAFNPCVNSDEITIVVNACTGIEEIENNSSAVIINPNPNNGVFSINSKISNYVITIIDVTGREVFKQTSQNENSQINVSDLQNGVYYIQISNNKQQVTQKMLIAK